MAAMQNYPKMYGTVMQTGVVNPASCQDLIADGDSQPLLSNTGTPTATKMQASSNQQVEQLANSLLYGVVNAIRAIPTMYGYAVIIFSHHTFASFMPALSKLVIFSSAVHQLMFTLLSSMPFAIGQVQDAGLIFLSAMATSICNSLGDDVSPQAKVATTIVTIGIATASLGVCLVIMGRFKLAALASYLPMPVIGGYLAFIGVFCLYAGLALSTGLVVNDFSSMLHMFDDAHNLLLCAPGFLGGATLLLVSQNFKNPFALSTAIMIMPVLFFLVLAIGGISLEDARDNGWVDPVEKTASITDLFSLFDFSLVHWEQIPKQVVTWLGMVFIVAISSSLDVVAIEIDMGSKLNINHELKTVGWSNVVSGLLGGYTGSYIFGQTIFTCRSQTSSRIVGVCVILAEIAIVTVPVSVMSYVPRFFLAATLFFVAMDLMLEWLVLAYRKMCVREWAVVWLSFLAINLVSLDVGMLIGIGLAALNFLLSYVQVPVVDTRLECSHEMKRVVERTVISRKRGAIAHFEFRGFLFFASVVQILKSVQRGVYIRKTNGAGDESFLPTSSSMTVQCLDGSPAPNVNAEPTEYVVMDFTYVSGMDATAARGAFLILKKYCRTRGISIVFANVLPSICNLLLKNDVAEDESFYPTADSALEFCESHLTHDVGSSRTDSLESASFLLQRLMNEVGDSQSLEEIDQYFRRREVPVGYEFFHVAEPSTSFFLLANGQVSVCVDELGKAPPTNQMKMILPSAMFGEVEFFSRQRRHTTATATEPCTVFEMTRKQFDALQQQAPTLSIRLRDVIVQSMALSITSLTISASE
ncbi:putative vacuolar membrane protein [Phytophthora citrophthora]|uniref:Vacuolar membrane protein n=1 Tax=Phytophthora citrophthora TaxID=4793 RepID=A0AAD9GPS3_9STRA|nr:putative vacuolar membrane protein [Phytophthora citrophthora]